jgi:FolB domain-containing protein
VDRLVIRDLAARCTLGVSDEERAEKQEVLLTIVLHADLARPAASDEFSETVDYRAIKKRVLAFVEGSRFHLLEALAEDTARTCLEVPAVQRVDVSIDKPGALRFARSVAVEITRSREAR